jgi:spore germination protein YaaH
VVFVRRVVSAVAEGFDAYNVDWEPTNPNISEADAQAYAAFLTLFADAMHAAGKKLSVDVATWSEPCRGILPETALRLV